MDMKQVISYLKTKFATRYKKNVGSVGNCVERVKARVSININLVLRICLEHLIRDDLNETLERRARRFGRRALRR